MYYLQIFDNELHIFKTKRDSWIFLIMRIFFTAVFHFIKVFTFIFQNRNRLIIKFKINYHKLLTVKIFKDKKQLTQLMFI